MEISKEHEDLQIMLNGEQLEQVGEFVYLGSTIKEDCKCGGDIRKRIGLASGVIGRLSKIWKSKDISVKTKVHVYKALVVPILRHMALNAGHLKRKTNENFIVWRGIVSEE